MSDQDKELLQAYGEAMLYAHLIEDLVALHLYECSYFHVNQYSGLSRKKIREMKHDKRINELLKIYEGQNERDGSITRLVEALHLLRKIRNHMTHAFIPQVGSDFAVEQGVDQIIAMLKNVAFWELAWLKILQKAHFAVLEGAVTKCFNEFMNREDPPFEAHVSKSKIQHHLDEISKQWKEK